MPGHRATFAFQARETARFQRIEIRPTFEIDRHEYFSHLWTLAQMRAQRGIRKRPRLHGLGNLPRDPQPRIVAELASFNSTERENIGGPLQSRGLHLARRTAQSREHGIARGIDKKLRPDPFRTTAPGQRDRISIRRHDLRLQTHFQIRRLARNGIAQGGKHHWSLQQHLYAPHAHRITGAALRYQTPRKFRGKAGIRQHRCAVTFRQSVKPANRVH
ncbi:hypothetical protein CfE428DRAFT_0935 [Chthoniobacter flavus Ellin428]|uniref:Uncharacterized protein n=1 Tax=Chthoniobacter flavus Ellin428 TaxID=497964 RepID=B4CW98_9BACT|nr:hypothetical protein [Chthoniobacter flavus]EDY21690.1 hypothetical protein CfE428DRAFT_0935 [Chthoniobacter flavus Ellin428]